MKIKTITLGRTVNCGNYESVRFDLTAELEGEDPDKAFKQLQKEVDSKETQLRREYKVKP